MRGEAVKVFVLELSAREMAGKRLGGRSQRAALRAQNEFIAWTDGRGYRLESIGPEELREYHKALCDRRSKKTGEPLAGHTVNTLFHQAGVLFSLLYREGVIRTNPALDLALSLPERRGVRRRPLNREEITRFLERIDAGTSQGLKDRTLFEVMYSSGLRVSEAAGLRVKDIDFDRREMVVRGKGDRDRAVPFSTAAREFLLIFLKGRLDEPEGWVFCGSRGSRAGERIRGESISERFRTLARRYGMDRKEISAHSIRHSTATHLLENGAGIREVQELLGHKNIETTVRYTQVQGEGVKKVYRKYHPREHELWEAVDGEYMRRLEVIIAGGRRG
jgi:site-specific recombinase XerD